LSEELKAMPQGSSIMPQTARAFKRGGGRGVEKKQTRENLISVNLPQAVTPACF
jgi:hypothetical protein